MALLPSSSLARHTVRLALLAGDTVAARKRMGSAGLRQPAAHS